MITFEATVVCNAKGCCERKAGGCDRAPSGAMNSAIESALSAGWTIENGKHICRSCALAARAAKAAIAEAKP